MTAPASGRPDPDGHHDDLSAEDLDGLSLLVPDDARELFVERGSWLPEEADSPPPQPAPPPWREGTRRSRRQRLSLTAGLIICSMLAVALSGVVGAFVLPAQQPGPPAAPLASVGPAPGQIGGLVPAATLTQAGAPVAARSLRPAVIALVPDGCDRCADLFREVRRQGVEFGIPLTLIGGPDQVAQLSDLETSLGAFRLDVFIDPARAFATSYGPTVPTLLLVRDDGVVADIVPDPAPDLRLESTLVSLSGDLAV